MLDRIRDTLDRHGWLAALAAVIGLGTIAVLCWVSTTLFDAVGADQDDADDDEGQRSQTPEFRDDVEVPVDR
jgi:hypothetical protein